MGDPLEALARVLIPLGGWAGHRPDPLWREGSASEVASLILAALNDAGYTLAARHDEPSPALRAFAEDIDKTITEAAIDGRHMAGTLLDVRWVPEAAVKAALALIPGLPCPMRSSLTDAPCVLSWGHPSASDERFHQFAANGEETREAVLTHPGDCPESLPYDHPSGAQGCIDAGYSPVGWGGW